MDRLSGEARLAFVVLFPPSFLSFFSKVCAFVSVSVLEHARCVEMPEWAREASDPPELGLQADKHQMMRVLGSYLRPFRRTVCAVNC